MRLHAPDLELLECLRTHHAMNNGRTRHGFIEKHDAKKSTRSRLCRLFMKRGEWSRHTENAITGNEYELFGWPTKLCLVSDISVRTVVGEERKKVSHDDLRLSSEATRIASSLQLDDRKTEVKKERKINDFWHRKIN